jgi:CRP-like cAMP-binding protein
MVGAGTFLERGTFGTAIVQFEGGAYRADIAAIEDICRQGEHLQPLMLRYMWTFLSRVLQSAAGDRHWSVEQRLSCWLLERLDRLPTNELKMTQEMIAGMLGVRRESITEAIGKLRRSGVVRCRRGSITVLDREELELLSGECYRGKALT